MREELITGTSNWHWNMGRERITGTGNRYWDKGTKDRGLFKPQVPVAWYKLLVPVLFLVPGIAFAQDPPKLTNPIKFPNLTSFLLEIVNTVIQYGAILIVFFIVFAGFKFVTAQ